MIQKNKPWTFLLLSVSLLMRIGLDVIVFTKPPWYARWAHDPSGTLLPTVLLASFATLALYLWGCILLANARGYSSAVVVAATIMAGIVSFWVPLVPFAMPLAVILSSPDKNRIHSRRRH